MRFYLASYPRSGNTFARYVLKQIFQIECLSAYGNEPEIRNLMPKARAWHGMQGWPSIFAVKTHEKRDASKKIPALYIVRDGRDAIVSQARYEQILGPYCNIAALMEPEDIQMHLVEGTWPRSPEEFWNWSSHLETWTTRDAPTVALRFEDLIVSPVSVLREALDFINVPYELDPDARLLTFSELNELDVRFFRRGQVGSHLTEMPEWIQRRCNELHGHMLERFEYQGIGT